MMSLRYTWQILPLWGPARVQMVGGKKYMMLCVDQGGAGTEGFFLANKRMETMFEVLKEYHAKSEHQTGKKLRCVRTDEGPEFVNSLWDDYCRETGIIHETTAAYSSSANGVVEHTNQTVLDRGRSMLFESGLPSQYWREACATALYLMDFIPLSRHPGITPYERRMGKKPDISHLRPFGCVAYAKIPKEHDTGKLGVQSIKCALIGYYGRGDYKLIDRSNGNIVRSRDIIFEEGLPHRTLSLDSVNVGEELDNTFTESSTGSAPEQPPIPTITVAPPPPPPEEAQALHRSARRHIPSIDAINTQITEEITAQAHTENADWAHDGLPTALSATREDDDASWDWENNIPSLAFATDTEGTRYHWFPTSYAEAMTRPDLWKAPMDKEMENMEHHGVWKLVKRPVGTRTMKNWWVFANKYDTEDAIEVRKARLVAKGFTQIPGIDDFFTYISVIHYESLRLNLVVGTLLDMEIWQVDYSSTYLNALNQAITYMDQPEGYQVTEDKFQEIVRNRGAGEKDENDGVSGGAWTIVAQLSKGLYGTMSGGYDWWVILDKDMRRLGYKRSRTDHSVRSRLIGKERTITGTYTDDVSGMSTTVGGAVKAQDELGEKYKIRRLGNIQLILGIHVERDRTTGTLTMSQGEYLKRILECHGMTDCTPKYTPLPPGIVLVATTSSLSPEEREFMANKPYRVVLGGVMYTQVSTRPDLSFAVAYLSRFSSIPNKSHWLALMHVLQYIKATLHYKLRYGGDGFTSMTPTGYMDSDFAANTDSRKSMSGQIFIQAGGPTSWGAKYQPTVATSTVEAEYMSMSRAA